MRQLRIGTWVVALAMSAVTGVDLAAQTAPPAFQSPEVLSDRRVAFRIYSPKATAVTLRGDWMEGDTTLGLVRNDEGRLGGDDRAAATGFLQLRLHGRRRANDRREESADQAGREQHRQHVPGSWPRGRVRGHRGCAARRHPQGLVPIVHARRTAAHARLHAAWIRRRERPLSGAVPAARRRRRGLGLEHDWPRRVHRRQPARVGQAAAAARRDAKRQPAAAGEFPDDAAGRRAFSRGARRKPRLAGSLRRPS